MSFGCSFVHSRSVYFIYGGGRSIQIFTRPYFGGMHAEVKAKLYGVIAAAQYSVPWRIVCRSRPRLPPIDFKTRVNGAAGTGRFFFRPLSNGAITPRDKYGKSTISRYFFQPFRGVSANAPRACPTKSTIEKSIFPCDFGAFRRKHLSINFASRPFVGHSWHLKDLFPVFFANELHHEEVVPNALSKSS